MKKQPKNIETFTKQKNDHNGIKDFLKWVDPSGESQTINEALEKNRDFPKYKQLRILGIVKEGSIINNLDGSILFEIEESGKTIKVKYKGIIPDIFADGVEAVVEGDFQDSIFRADKLFAKSPTKYEDEEYRKEQS